MSLDRKIQKIAITQPINVAFDPEVAKEVLGEDTEIILAIKASWKGVSIPEVASWNWKEKKNWQKSFFRGQVMPILKRNPTAEVNYMGVAPIPMAIHMGFLAQQCSNDLTALNRDHGTKGKSGELWKWKGRKEGPYKPNIETTGLRTEATDKSGDIILSISASYEVDIPDTQKAVQAPIAEIGISVYPIGKNELKSEEEMLHVAEVFGDVLDKIQRLYGKDSVVHLFTGIPTGLAFMLGTQIHPSTHPNVVTYQYVKSRKSSPKGIAGHQKAIVIGMDNILPVKIMLVGANPVGSPPLAIGKEFSEIKSALTGSLDSERFEVIPVEGTRSSLVNALIKHRPQILHFSGHGTEDKSPKGVKRHLEFENDAGASDPIYPFEWESLFKNLDYTLQAVILNACHSHNVTKKIVPFVGCAITMTTSIEDRDAITFANTLYIKLADKLDFRKAFELAKVAAGFQEEAHFEENTKGLSNAKVATIHDSLKSKTSEEIFAQIEEAIDLLLPKVESFFTGLKKRKPSYDWMKGVEKTLEQVTQKWTKRRFQVSIMALVKAGKSTLLNSWIGDEYLPSAAIAETMRIIKIRHIPEKPIGVLFEGSKEIARGAEGIRKEISHLNKQARKDSSKVLPELRLEVNVAALSNSPLGRYGFDILDTPGTNEAGLNSLRATIERIAKCSDVIIYVLDFTKLNTTDEKDILNSIKGWKERLFQHSQTRVFFVVNKIDRINRHERAKSLTLKNTKSYVKDTLNKEVKINVDANDIVLISSERALLSRRIESGKATDGQLFDFKQISFGELGAENATPEEVQEAVPKLLEKSGFDELNKKVLGSVIQNRSNILFSSILDDLSELVSGSYNAILVEKMSLQSSKEEVLQLSRQINETMKKVKGINTKVGNFKKKAIDIVSKVLRNFEAQAYEEVKAVFASSPLSAKVPRGFFNLLGEQDFEISSTNENAIWDQLDQINYLFTNSVKSSFSLAWNRIVEALHNEFNDFSSFLQEQLQPILEEIETHINERWDIRLEPQNINIPYPSLETFFRDMNEQMTQVVTVEVKSNLNWLDRIFNPILRFLGVGLTEVKYEKYAVSGKEYRKKLKKVIPSLNEKAQTHAIKLIEQKYLETNNQAIGRLRSFEKKYVHIMDETIKAKSKGVLDIGQRIELLEKDQKEVEFVRQTLDRTRNVLKLKPKLQP